MNIKINDILKSCLIVNFHFIFFNWWNISYHSLFIPIHLDCKYTYNLFNNWINIISKMICWILSCFYFRDFNITGWKVYVIYCFRDKLISCCDGPKLAKIRCFWIFFCWELISLPFTLLILISCLCFKSFLFANLW